MRQIIAVILSVSGSLAFAAPASSPELIQAGHDLFMNNCAVCHGDKGLGDGPASAGLTPKPRNLVKDPFKGGATKDKIFGTVTKGLAGTQMPGFPQLSDQERWSLVFYVLSLRKK